MIHLWPRPAPGALGRNDNGDFVLHEWIMAWVAHQVVTSPFPLRRQHRYPGRASLYSDHLFVQSMLVHRYLV